MKSTVTWKKAHQSYLLAKYAFWYSWGSSLSVASTDASYNNAIEAVNEVTSSKDGRTKAFHVRER